MKTFVRKIDYLGTFPTYQAVVNAKRTYSVLQETGNTFKNRKQICAVYVCVCGSHVGAVESKVLIHNTCIRTSFLRFVLHQEERKQLKTKQKIR